LLEVVRERFSQSNECQPTLMFNVVAHSFALAWKRSAKLRKDNQPKVRKMTDGTDEGTGKEKHPDGVRGLNICCVGIDEVNQGGGVLQF
jgi:hypothetical protein